MKLSNFFFRKIASYCFSAYVNIRKRLKNRLSATKYFELNSRAALSDYLFDDKSKTSSFNCVIIHFKKLLGESKNADKLLNIK